MMTEALDFEITKDILSKVTKQAIVGVPQDSIGMILGFTKDEFVVDLDGATGDYLEVLIQDDLSGLADFEIKGKGRLFGG